MMIAINRSAVCVTNSETIFSESSYLGRKSYIVAYTQQSI